MGELNGGMPNFSLRDATPEKKKKNFFLLLFLPPFRLSLLLNQFTNHRISA